MTMVGVGGRSNSMKHYGKLTLRTIKWGELLKAPVAVAGLHSLGSLQPNDESKYTALTLTFSSYFLPMSVKAVIDLGIPDILAKAERGRPLSSQEILAKLPTKSTPGPSSVINLRRLMRPLVQHGVFTETLNNEKQPVYGLTGISKWYVRDNELSLAPFADYMLTPHMQSSFGHLQQTILDDNANSFAVEHGMNFYQYMKQHPQYLAMFDNAMISMTRGDVEEVVKTFQDSGWLEGVKTFVDVGGGMTGRFVGEIVARNPHIHGINFDQPHVVEKSPELKGVRFVGGDFLKSVPSGDVMFMKVLIPENRLKSYLAWVTCMVKFPYSPFIAHRGDKRSDVEAIDPRLWMQLVVHNYDDEVCIKILENCFEALPKGGKIILAETLVRDSDKTSKASLVLAKDLTMLGCFKGGRERTIEEYQKVLEVAGFSQFSVIENQTAIDLITGIKQ